MADYQSIPLLSGDWINEENLSKLVLTKTIDKRMADLLIEIIPVLNVFYPDRWDIQLETSDVEFSREGQRRRLYRRKDSFVCSIVIYFPDLIITNTRKAFHNMKNLYAKIPLTFTVFGKINISKLQAQRLSLTKMEYRAKYHFSHIPSDDLVTLSWKSCCLGESELVDTIVKYNLDNNISFLKLLLLQLEGYFQWESLEGVPHIAMSRVHGRSRLGSDATVFTEDKVLVRELLSKIPLLDTARVNISLENGNFKIKDDEVFEDFLLTLYKFAYRGIPSKAVISGSTRLSRQLCYISDNGELFLIKNKTFPALNYIVSKEPFLFKGEKRYAFLQDSPEILPDENLKIILNPNIKNYARKQLEKTLTKERLKKYAIEVLHSCTY
jgi:hypothetical protein